MIVTLNFSGSTWGCQSYFKDYRGWSEWFTIFPATLIFSIQRVPGFIVGTVVMLYKFYSDGAWGFLIVGGIAMGGMAVVSIPWGMQQWEIASGYLAKLGVYKFCNMRGLWKWKRSSAIQEALENVAKDAKVVELRLNDGRPILLGEEQDEGFGFKRFKVRIGSVEDKAVEVIFDGNFIRLAADKQYVLEGGSLGSPVYFVYNVHNSKSMFQYSEGGYIHICGHGGIHDPQWHHIGIAKEGDDDVVLVGGLGHFLEFDTSEWEWERTGLTDLRNTTKHLVCTSHPGKAIGPSGRQMEWAQFLVIWYNLMDETDKNALKFAFDGKHIRALDGKNIHGLTPAAGNVGIGSEILGWFATSIWKHNEDGSFSPQNYKTEEFNDEVRLGDDCGLKLVHKDSPNVLKFKIVESAGDEPELPIHEE